jgi:hypothetical protein
MIVDSFKEIINYQYSTIYLSSTESLIFTNDLQTKDIQVIISLSGERVRSDQLQFSTRVKHYYYQVHDNENQDILFLFDPIFRIIYHAIDRNKNILIHCPDGKSTSVALLISFFLRSIKDSPEYIIPYIPKTCHWWTMSILSFIQIQKPDARPNQGFIAQLYAYEEEILQDVININYD